MTPLRNPATLATLALLGSAALFAPRAALAAGEIECAPTQWLPLWTDRGSGASRDVSFFRPASGFTLGDHAQGGGAPGAEACGFGSSVPGALAPPTGFTQVYNDRGTGAHQDGSIWRANCPAGYRALGYVNLVGHALPANLETIRFRCVRQDLVRDVGRNLTDVWNDRKSGGKQDVSVWGWSAYGSPSPGISAHTYFMAHGSYGPPNPQLAVTLAPGVLRYTPPGPPTRAKVEEWMKQYAPIVHFHPGEKYFPTSAEAFLANTTAVGGGLALRDTSDTGKGGDLSKARAYVNAKVSASTTELQYWYLYAYNGAGTAYFKYLKLYKYESLGDHSMAPCGQHEGDWEHITVAVDNRTGAMKGVYLSQHSGGAWYAPLQVNYGGNRVQFYASVNGHAAYFQPGRYYSHEIKSPSPIEFRLLNDAATGGRTFDSRTGAGPALMAVNFLDPAANAAPPWNVAPAPWMTINGRWGRIHSRGAVAAQADLERRFGSVGGALASLGTLNLANLIMDKAGLKEECSQETGPVPPWQKGSWRGPDN